jgi:hypothetical protein
VPLFPYPLLSPATVPLPSSKRALSSYVLWLYNQTSRIKTIKQPATHVLEVGMKIVVYDFMHLALKRLSGLRQTFHVLSIKRGSESRLMAHLRVLSINYLLILNERATIR